MTGDWCWWNLTAYSTRNLKAATRKLKADEERAHSQDNAHHCAKHAVTRLPRQRCRRPAPRFCAAGANGKNICRCRSARSNARANPLYAEKLAGVGFASILRTFLPAAPPASPVSPALAAKTLPTTPTRERLISATARVKGYYTDKAIFTLLCCTTDEFFFSCCDNRSNRQRRRVVTANDPNS